MNLGRGRVRMEHGATGAARAARRGDVVVVVDALRASVTVVTALVLGAERVVPVLSLEAARGQQGRSRRLVAGERGGAKPPGFDFGNSPKELVAHAGQLGGRTLVLTTSHGTRAMLAARGGSAAVLIGSLPNATAVARTARAVAEGMRRDIALVAVGSRGGPAAEDDFAAAFLAAQIAGEPLPAGSPREIFWASDSAHRIAQLGYADDVTFCAGVDRFDVVPILRRTAFEACPTRLLGATATPCGEG
jgi:phosphosulfolactate phosphohydrolase-like enzyme